MPHELLREAMIDDNSLEADAVMEFVKRASAHSFPD